ncbi:hypothetical protein HY643_05310 [Candidatus Woesearchaeota archaeon]|nr:hypothetical protein [Candidatus Woesearchaeota archaeon]
MKEPILPKKIGWIILAILVFIDSFLDVIRGVEGNPLWTPIINIIGIKNAPFLVPFVLSLFYLAVKALGWIVEKIDKTPRSEELILTALVIVYAIFDIWAISVDFLGFSLIPNFRYMIIPMTIIGLGYALWAQKKLGKKK